MNSRWMAGLALLAAFASAAAQDSGDRFADGLVAGGYLRVSGGTTNPINPQGGFRYWDQGSHFSVEYESWGPGSLGVSKVGVGFAGAYIRLPLNGPRFASDFGATSTGTVTGATGSGAGVFELATTLRVRFPMPFLMPSIGFGIGFIDWVPGRIHYTTTGGTGSAKQQNRAGAELKISGAVDKNIVSRFGIFAEAQYAYGYTSFGGGYVAPGGVCQTGGCDVLKNVSFGILRAGARVRVTR